MPSLFVAQRMHSKAGFRCKLQESPIIINIINSALFIWFCFTLQNSAFMLEYNNYAQNVTWPLTLSFLPRMKVLHLFKTLKHLVLVLVHSNFKTTFFVYLAFFLKMGFVCPPNPFYFMSYLLFPWAVLESLPFLYWETLCKVCFFAFLQ